MNQTTSIQVLVDMTSSLTSDKKELEETVTNQTARIELLEVNNARYIGKHVKYTIRWKM